MSSKESAIGYKRPPMATQFKPGQSGNPTGRRKGVPNLKTELIAELNEVVTFEEGGHKSRFTRQRAIVKRLVGLAIEGDIRAINAIVALCQTLEPHATKAQEEEEIEKDGDDIMSDYLDKERRRSESGTGKSEKEPQ